MGSENLVVNQGDTERINFQLVHVYTLHDQEKSERGERVAVHRLAKLLLISSLSHDLLISRQQMGFVISVILYRPYKNSSVVDVEMFNSVKYYRYTMFFFYLE